MEMALHGGPVVKQSRDGPRCPFGDGLSHHWPSEKQLLPLQGNCCNELVDKALCSVLWLALYLQPQQHQLHSFGAT